VTLIDALIEFLAPKAERESAAAPLYTKYLRGALRSRGRSNDVCCGV